MCCIAGAIHLNAQIDEDTFLSIRDQLSHHGPDCAPTLQLINMPVNFRLPSFWVILQRPLLGIFKRAPTWQCVVVKNEELQ